MFESVKSKYSLFKGYWEISKRGGADRYQDQGRAMAQVVSRLLLLGSSVQSRVNQCGWYLWWKSGNGTGFSSSTSFFLCHYYSTSTHHLHLLSLFLPGQRTMSLNI